MNDRQLDYLQTELPPTRHRCKSFVKWAGGKKQLLPELLQRLPKKFNRYFEPFVGGGALFFELVPREACLVDDNDELINVYTMVRDHVQELIDDLSRHVYEKDYYYELRNADREESFSSWSPVQRASRLLYLNKSCFNGLYRVNSKGQFNVPFGRYKNPTILDRGNLLLCSQALQGCELVCGSFLEVENRVREGDFVYCDPPYAPMSKTANFTKYDIDGFTESDQHDLRDLCDRLTDKGAYVLVSNSFTDFTEELYKDMHIDVVYASRAINVKADRRGKIAEIIATNY